MPQNVTKTVLLVVVGVATFLIVQAIIPHYAPAPPPTPREPVPAPPAAGEPAPPAAPVPEIANPPGETHEPVPKPDPETMSAPQRQPTEELTDVHGLLEAFEIAAARGDRVAALAYLERAAERHPGHPELQKRLQQYRQPAVASVPAPGDQDKSPPTTDAELDALRVRARGVFAVHFAGPEQLALVQPALDILQDAYLEVRGRLGVVPKRPVVVIIYTGGAYARSLTTRQWEVARFDGKVRVSQSDLLAARGALRRVLFHEYVHAIFYDAPSVPAWFHEGLAQYLEPPGPPWQRQLVFRAVTGGQYLGLAELHRSFLRYDDATTAGLAYAESLSLIEFLLVERGESRLRGLVQRVVAGENFSSLMSEIYAADPRRLEQRWVSWVKRG